MKSFKTLFIVFTLVAFLLSGCLTAEYKEYKYELTSKGSGKLTIKYYNIMSKKDSEDLTLSEETDKDYQELLDKYVYGTEIEKDYPDAKVLKKELIEENGKLCAIVVLEFSEPAQAKLYKHDKKSPYMYMIKSLSSETFYQSNGKMGPDFMSVVFWESDAKDLNLTNSITAPDDKTTSLLSKWKASKR